MTIPIKSSVEESLNAFIKDDTIEDYNCASCQCKRQAIKRVKIFKTPMVLFLHFRRFRQLENGRTIKDNRFVEIPRILDLNPYCDHEIIPESNLTNKYILKGISNHHGGMGGGHYTADCLSIIDNKTWYHFDDSSVSKYDGSDINTSNAYVLLYEME